MLYNKLVRDKIQQIIVQKGGKPITHIANNEEYGKKLDKKLQEEVSEYFESKDVGELVDILEVVYAISEFKGVDRDGLEALRKKKADERGAFKEKIILEES